MDGPPSELVPPDVNWLEAEFWRLDEAMAICTDTHNLYTHNRDGLDRYRHEADNTGGESCIDREGLSFLTEKRYPAELTKIPK